METITRQMRKDIKLLGRFTEVWCAGYDHPQRRCFELPDELGKVRLCDECIEFMQYAIVKRFKCPLEAEKPSCKHCRIHCYATEQRAKVRQIMAWSGRRMLLRGRLDYLYHYFF